MTNSIAIIGLGVLGSAIAKFLLENGFQVYGFDISKKALANFNNNEKFYACSSVDEIFHKESNRDPSEVSKYIRRPLGVHQESIRSPSGVHQKSIRSP